MRQNFAELPLIETTKLNKRATWKSCQCFAGQPLTKLQMRKHYGIPAYTLRGYRLQNYKTKKGSTTGFAPTLCGATAYKTTRLNKEALRDSRLHFAGLLLTKKDQIREHYWIPVYTLRGYRLQNTELGEE